MSSASGTLRTSRRTDRMSLNCFVGTTTQRTIVRLHFSSWSVWLDSIDNSETAVLEVASSGFLLSLLECLLGTAMAGPSCGFQRQVATSFCRQCREEPGSWWRLG